MATLAAILLVALTRAEIIARMRAPVVTQADGFVQVFADCPEDMRREYQSPVARFAANTVETLRRGERAPAHRFRESALRIHLGDIRTNVTDVAVRVSTNASGAVTRLYLKSPGYADLERLRLEVAKAYFRSALGREADDQTVRASLRRGDPRLRIADERAALERFFAGETADDEAGLAAMRKVIEPGVASPREVLVYAARLWLYPAVYGVRFAGRYDALSFREAARLAPRDLRIRFAARLKCDEPAFFALGRGEALSAAGQLYAKFLRRLSDVEAEETELLDILDAADMQLNLAYEQAVRTFPTVSPHPPKGPAS